MNIVAVSLSQVVVSCEHIFSRITTTYWLQLSNSKLLVQLPFFIYCSLHREISQTLSINNFFLSKCVICDCIKKSTGH